MMNTMSYFIFQKLKGKHFLVKGKVVCSGLNTDDEVKIFNF